MNTRPPSRRLPSTRCLARALCLASLAAVCTVHAATITSTWTNAASGTWNVDANWTNVAPSGGFPNNGGGTTYEALISATGTAYTVTLNSSVTVETLSLASANATLSHTAGTLATNFGLNISAGTYRLAGLAARISNSAITLSGTGALTIAGGTIAGSTITGSSAAGVSVAPSGTASFDAVSLSTDLTIANGATLNVSNGLVLGNSAKIMLGSAGAASVLRFGSGAQTLGGTGEVVIAGSGSNTLQAVASGTIASALTIGNNITIRASSPSAFGTITTSGANSSILNQGTILASTTNAIIALGGSWSNTGLLQATNGGTIRLGGTFTTAGLGPYNSNGGTMAITGTLDNTGNTLNIVAASGPLTLSAGTIKGGTVTASGGAGLLVAANFGNTLDGVNLGTDISVPAGSILHGSLQAINGLTLSNNARITLNATSGTACLVTFRNGAQTLGGTGEIIFSGADTNLVRAEGDGTLATAAMFTIGPGITIHGPQSGSVATGSAFDSIINQGRILADTAGEVVNISGNFNNQGAVAASLGTIQLSATGYTNAGGTLAVSGSGILNLGGTFTQASLGPITRSGGTVNLTGTLDNTGGTLALNVATGSWNLSNGTIKGGTVTGSGGAGLAMVSPNDGTLDGVTLATDISVPTSSQLNVTNGLTLSNNAKVTLVGSAAISVLQFGAGIQTLSAALGGTGEVVFAGSTGQNYLRAFGAGTVASNLTIGPGITVRGTQGGLFQTSGVNDSILNQGTILADGAGKTVTLSGNWSNSGLLRAMNGGALNLGGTFTTAELGTFNSSGGTVAITGALDNTGSTLALTAATGPLTLSGGGIIKSGTVAASVGVSLLVPASAQGTLEGVTLGTDVAVSNNAILRVTNQLTLSNISKVALESTAGSSQLLFESGAQTLGGTGEVIFGGSGAGTNLLRAFGTSTGASNLTIGPGVIVRGTQNGTIQAGNAIDSIVNQGTIVADAPGKTITITGNFANAGALHAGLSGTVSVPGGYNQTVGTTRLAGGSLTTMAGSTIGILGGLLEGTGIVAANVANSGTISPGLSADALAITRDLFLTATSDIRIELGGTTQGTQYDLLSEAGTIPLTLAGTLSVSFLNGFETTVQASDLFTIIASNQAITGAFANLAGGRIATTDGFGTFAVNLAGNNVTLGNWVPVPEPSSAVLFLAGMAPVLMGRRRRASTL